jgi:hypothetical protein
MIVLERLLDGTIPGMKRFTPARRYCRHGRKSLYLAMARGDLKQEKPAASPR